MLIDAAIRAEVLPRLLVAHAGEHLAPPPPRFRAPDPVHPALPAHDAFEAALVAGEVEVATALVERAFEGGAEFEDVLFDLILPVSRRFAEAWDSERLGFADMSIAMSTLQVVARRLDPVVERDRPVPRGATPRLFLSAAPGDDHDLGVVLIEQLFRRDGFEVVSLFGADEDTIVRVASEGAFDLLGFSIGRATLLPRLAALVARIGERAGGRHVPVMVGGAALAHDPRACAALAADALIMDARDAVDVGRALLAS
jgi:MerR family transcriptional regulator, light-induced transcriptional regulator